MKELIRRKKIVNFKPINSFFSRIALGAMFVYYVANYMDEPFINQLGYFILLALVSVAIDYFAMNTKQAAAIKICDDKFELLNVPIELSEIKEVLYCQTKRFEHTIRFSYNNSTYRDFELSDVDLIDDLRFYHFLVENRIPVKMLDNPDRFYL